MKTKFYYPLVLLLTIIISFPAISFSEMKTIEHEKCGKYKGDMKNKKEFDDFRRNEKETSTISGILSLTDPSKNKIKIECIRYILDNYLEKSEVIIHKEKGRNICNKVRITFDPDMVDQYLTQEDCVVPETKKGDRWILYGSSKSGHHYYDKSSIVKVRPNIINVWTKIKLSKVEKDRVIQLRKDDDRPIDGWEKLDYTIFLFELDCVNNTIKGLKIVDYNEEENIIDNTDISNPRLEQIIPITMEELLLRKVCPKSK